MVHVENETRDADDDRNTDLARRKAGLPAHLKVVEKILDAARERDIEADGRDQISVARDRDADAEAFTSTESRNGYGADLLARRHAALDRRSAKSDRTSAALDRDALTKIADDLEVPAQDVLKRREHEGTAQPHPEPGHVSASCAITHPSSVPCASGTGETAAVVPSLSTTPLRRVVGGLLRAWVIKVLLSAR